MCFELDSVPPIPPISGGAPVRSEDVVLQAADGTRFAAFAARPDDGARVGIVVLPDVRGLYGFYEQLALRFAERGYAAAGDERTTVDVELDRGIIAVVDALRRDDVHVHARDLSRLDGGRDVERAGGESGDDRLVRERDVRLPGLGVVERR